MRKIVLPDFIDVNQLVTAELQKALESVPHLLSDLSGRVISENQAESVADPEREILLFGKPVARIRSIPAQIETLPKLLESFFLMNWDGLSVAAELEQTNILTKDIDSLLDLSESENLDLNNLLINILRILRSHVWVENASIFGIYDGFTLEGLAGIGGDNQEDWRLSFESAAGIAATTRKIFRSENPSADPSFTAKKGLKAPRNLLCVPLIHGNTLVGVMNLSNRIGGEFTEKDIKLMDRFSNLTAHVLQKDFLKRRMQTFEKTSDHLGKYLSSKVVKNVKSLNQLQLGGEEKYVVCLFSDIRGYTSISEEIEAPVLVKLLNFYFEKMHAVIEKHEGTLDKIVGDLIMAVWNIPMDQPDPEFLAVKTALEMQKEMIRVVSPEWASQGVSNVGMGIGVNAGSAIVGNLGSSRFMNYTVVGDAVNTAQRLESKAKGGEIWVSESIFEKVSGRIEKPIRKESGIHLKGKEHPIDAYVYRPLSY